MLKLSPIDAQAQPQKYIRKKSTYDKKWRDESYKPGTQPKDSSAEEERCLSGGFSSERAQHRKQRHINATCPSEQIINNYFISFAQVDPQCIRATTYVSTMLIFNQYLFLYQRWLGRGGGGRKAGFSLFSLKRGLEVMSHASSKKFWNPKQQ